jgi:hypothetical protein
MTIVKAHMKRIIIIINNNNNNASINTKQKAQRLRIQNEIKYLYKKKQQMNRGLYHSHLYNANQWKNLWTHIEQNINDKLHLEIGTKLENQAETIHNIKMKCISIQNNDTQNEHNTQFYTRLVNNTNKTF